MERVQRAERGERTRPRVLFSAPRGKTVMSQQTCVVACGIFVGAFGLVGEAPTRAREARALPCAEFILSEVEGVGMTRYFLNWPIHQIIETLEMAAVFR